MLCYTAGAARAKAAKPAQAATEKKAAGKQEVPKTAAKTATEKATKTGAKATKGN
jgi:hypothetical protein